MHRTHRKDYDMELHGRSVLVLKQHFVDAFFSDAILCMT